jgi:hypothetical protein
MISYSEVNNVLNIMIIKEQKPKQITRIKLSEAQHGPPSKRRKDHMSWRSKYPLLSVHPP